MEWRGDNRGQSVQVGAILLFATLIIALSTYQVAVVPEENSRIEFDAYQEASADIVELRNGVLSTAAGDGVRGVTVKTGAQYPPRIFLVNTLQPRGSVETTNPGTITLRNVNGSVSQYKGVGEYVQEEGNVLNYSTKLLRFEPDYNYASAANIFVTNGFVYRDYDRPIPRASQTLIRGNTITVTTIAGNLDESGYQASLTAVPVSAHVNTVTVTNESAGPVNVTIPTRLNATDWNDTVLAGSKKYVVDNRVIAGPRPDTVTIRLNASENYELKVAQVEVKGANDDDEVDDPDARYLVQQTDEYATLNVDDRVKLVAESRDIFNNPRSNSPVTFETGASNNLTLASTSGSLSGNELTIRSNADGNVAVWAEAAGDVNDATVTATLGTDTSGTNSEQVTFKVSEPQADGGGGGGSGFSSTGTTSIVPNAGSQTQTIEFTMDSAMDASESIEVDLSEAQSVSPDQVDYQSGSASVVSGPSPSNIGFAQQSSTDAVVTYSPSSDLSAGQTVTLEVTGVSAGPTDSQNDPYTVTWSRSDGGSKTTTFSVARDVGDANLQSVAASDLGSGPGQTQTLSFTPDDALEGGERVAIDLSDAQAGAVDYSNAGVNSVSTGSASKNQNGDTVYVTYTAPSGGVASGTTVDVELSGVEVTGSGTYETGFSRARGDTASASFSAGGGGADSNSLNAVAGSTPVGETDTLSFDIENTGSTDVTVTGFSISTPGRQNPGVSQVTNIDRSPGNNEVEISGDEATGTANPDNPPSQSGYSTDGTTYSLDSEAVISGGATASVDMGDLNDGNVQLTYSLASGQPNSDVTVTLLLSDGSSKDVYLRVTNVNS